MRYEPLASVWPTSKGKIMPKDTHLYLGIAVSISLLATGLLLHHNVTEATWYQTITWVWSSTVLGGAVAAFRK